METTAAYGSFFFSSSVEDAAVILWAAMDVAATTVVSGLSFFSSSAEDAETIHLATIIADAMIAANKRNDGDGFGRPFCIL